MKLGWLLLLVVAVVYGKPVEVEEDEPVCGYDACHPIDHDKLNVHVVPHSHDDVGWLKTVDQYFYQQVQYIITSVVSALLENPDRRFIQVETAYFYMWWKLQNDYMKTKVKQLINEGRLEIINGAWSMNDEAAVHYQSTIDQYTLGLKFLQDNFGKCARPRVGWQIDPFGHSREQASLLSQMGMDAVFFARVDYRDKEKRLKEKSMDMLWTGSANLGSDSNILASVLYKHYSAPNNYCFDITCSDLPIIVDPDSPEYNYKTKVYNFAQMLRDIYPHYPTNHLLIPFGDDFKWEAAHNYFINLDLLIEGFKKFNDTTVDGKEVNIIYSTPSCYAKAVRDYLETKNVELKATKQITAAGRKNYNVNLPLSQAMGVMQHHDAITGTEKMAVEKDYHRMLVKAMNTAISDFSSTLSTIASSFIDLNLSSCLLANVSICEQSDKDEFQVIIYNSLPRDTSHYIYIPVNDGVWNITGPSDVQVAYQLLDPIINFGYIHNATLQKVLDKVLVFRAEDVPGIGYKTYTFQRIHSESIPVKVDPTKKTYTGNNIEKIGFEDRYINFDTDTGLLKSITLNGVTLAVSQDFFYYNSKTTSGAYIFTPNGEALKLGNVTNTVLVNDGDLVREVKQVWNDWVTQIIRVYKEEDFVEFDWVIGPIDTTDGFGKEVITRYTTELDSKDEFYTDSNGREMIYRKRDYRPTYNYTNNEPQAGNYYPVNTRIVIKDGETEFAVLTDRSEGGSSLKSGEVELMLSRSLLHDDAKGVGENLKEEEYNQPLVVRGSHYITLGKSSVGNGEKTMAAVEREIVQRQLLQPWVFFPAEEVKNKELTYIYTPLPPNVNLLTYQTWNVSESTFLLRLEHMMEKDEDPVLSQEVTVDVGEIFKTLHVQKVKEYFLGANTPLEESTRLQWHQIDETESESSPLSLKNRLARDETDLKITLAPMQIRTFILYNQDYC
ncbi:hypothetical protein NQ318_012295 [Aromia moschata]|uniref:alpha-mannosidase n=1 Tax=Aromia moschata TaxID=1265417 RepID=A0AAV8YJY6_9CUCU|nr:hypothetical protein NQ318_012295 [Aromia moschata]